MKTPLSSPNLNFVIPLFSPWRLLVMLLILFCSFISSGAFAQSKQWDKTFGGNRDDIYTVSVKTPDGGYLLGGSSNTGNNGDKSDPNWGENYYPTSNDYWVVKVDTSGNKVWDKTFGGNVQDYLTAIEPTTDGGYLLGGFSASGITGDKTQANRGEVNFSYDYWVVKIGANGNKVWDKRFGGRGTEELRDIIPTPDGGYLLGGSSNSGKGGDKTITATGTWVVKINATGTKVWDKVFSGGATFQKFLATPDNGYLLAGNKITTNAGTNYWVVKLNNAYAKVWEKNYGGLYTENLGDVIAAADGGFILGGASNSGIGGDKSEANYSCTSSNSCTSDFWVVKINPEGTKVWDKVFGGTRHEVLNSMVLTEDNHYLLGGLSASGVNGNKSEDNRGWEDFWLVKIDVNGSKIWDKTFGGDNSDFLKNILPTADGGYLLGGYSNSDISGEKTTARRGFYNDYWIIKLDASSKIDQTITFAPIPEKALGDAPFALSAQASSGEPITL